MVNPAQLWSFTLNDWVSLPSSGPTPEHIRCAVRAADSGPYAVFWQVDLPLDPSDLIGILFVVHALDSSGNPAAVLESFPSPYYSPRSVAWVR